MGELELVANGICQNDVELKVHVHEWEWKSHRNLNKFWWLYVGKLPI